MRDSLFETIVGLGVVATALLFLVFSLGQRSEAAPRDSYTLTASFNRVDGINVGSDVRLAGKKVGVVSSIDLDPEIYRAVVTLTLPRTVRYGGEDKPLRIPDDSTAQIVSDGLLGGAYLNLSIGGSFDYLPEGGRLEYTRGSVDLLGVLSEFARSAGGGDGSENDGAATEDQP
jgi:phospholipid/cholesterol/gamma-HCH transport system substrate-binding protein